MDDGKLAWRFADCQQFYSFAAVLESLVLLKNERKPVVMALWGHELPEWNNVGQLLAILCGILSWENTPTELWSHVESNVHTEQ